MPYTLKTGQMSVKNSSTGQYTGIDVVAETSKDELIAEITQAGQTAKSDVVAKGAEVLETIPADYTELQNDVDDLKSSFTNDVVQIVGENQVTPQNIYGLEFTKTSVEVPGDDFFNESYLFEENYYVSINANVTPPVITHAALANYKAYCIPVDNNSTYRFTSARFAALAKGNTLGSEAVGTLQSYVTEIETGEANYIFLSYPSSTSTIEIRKLETQTVYGDFVVPYWFEQTRTKAKDKFVKATGNLASNGFFKLSARTSVRKQNRVVFTADVSTFSTLSIGKASDVGDTIDTKSNLFVIDGTNVSYYFTNLTTPSEQTAHGLTIKDNIQIIMEESDANTLKFTIISDGSSFTHDFSYRINTIGAPFVLTGDAMSNCTFLWTCADIEKKTWLFGDSYLQNFPYRWAYYLQEYGYSQNVLIDAYPGEGSTSSRSSLAVLLNHAIPNEIIWCLGMNDGTDSNNTPSSGWVSGRDYFLGYCAENHITPIFATIPSVPSINHEAKNAWIRASGFRYIDLAKAVGAQANGTWFDGMLSEDNVHPTVKGAKALFAQFICDYPEIMIGAENTPTAVT